MSSDKSGTRNGADVLRVTNKIYKECIDAWKLYNAAYMGGEEWKAMKLLYEYVAEKSPEYEKRIRQTPLENHCESVITTYSGFIWRDPPKRSLGKLEENHNLNRLLINADMDGTPLNEVMKSVQIWGGVYGVVWVVMDKPTVQVATKADEIRDDLRPYVRLYMPEDVLDFEFTQQPNGSTVPTYLKTRTENNTRQGCEVTVIEWTESTITTTTLLDNTLLDESEKPNPIGVVPAALYSNMKSTVRGKASSDLVDISGMQVSIYNDYSELSQMIRGSNHKTLVKNLNDEASTGAGGVIIMDPDSPPEKKPYLLQADAEALAGLLKAIATKTEAINRMAHLTPVRTYRKQVTSAIAMETEFQILNTLLSQKSAQLQLCEYRLFDLFCRWEEIKPETTDYEVVYPLRFELRDRKADLEFLLAARDAAEKVGSKTLIREINKLLARVSLQDDSVIEVIDREIGGE